MAKLQVFLLVVCVAPCLGSRQKGHVDGQLLLPASAREMCTPQAPGNLTPGANSTRVTAWWPPTLVHAIKPRRSSGRGLGPKAALQFHEAKPDEK